MEPSSFLLTHFDRLAEAPGGTAKLRALIVQLAMQGKLVPQSKAEEPASALLGRIRAEKHRLIAKGAISKEKPLPEVEPDQTPFEIPATWAWSRLGDALEYSAGENASPDELPTNGWLLELEDIEKDTSRLLTEARVSDRNPTSHKTKFRIGDVLYGKLRPYLNKVLVAHRDGFCTTEIIALRPLCGVEPQFIKWALKRPDFLAYVARVGYGTKMPRLGTDDGRVAFLPLPPLAEQRRIVAKVEKLMGLCDALEAAQWEREKVRRRLRTSALHQLASPDSDSSSAAFVLQNLPLLTDAPEDLLSLRQSVLKLAVQGRLVARRPEDGTGLRLLKEIETAKKIALEEKRVRRLEEFSELGQEELLHETPENWTWSRLGSVFDVRDGTHDTPKYYERGVPLVTSKNLYSGILDLAGCKLISEEDHASISERSGVERDDILFAMIGTIGNPVIVDVTPHFSIKNVALFKYYDRALSDPRYLLLYLKYAAAIMRSRATGGLQPFVSLGFLRAFPIPFPPLAEQRRIVAKVDELMATLDTLETALTTARITAGSLLSATLGSQSAHS